MTKSEKSILTVTALGHFLSHYNMLVFPAILLPLSGKLGLELSETVALSFWQYLLFGVTALPWGFAADRWGAKPLMIIYFLGAALCGAAAGFNIDSPEKLTAALAGIGLFSGIYHPAGLGLISRSIKQLSLGMGINGMFGNLGLATAPFLAGIIVHLLSLKAVYIALSLLNFGGFLLMLFLKLEEPEASPAQHRKGIKSSLTPFVILLFTMMMGGIAYRGATVITPAYFEINCSDLFGRLASLFSFDMTANLMATTVASIIYLIGMAGQYLGGRTGERFEVRWAYFLFHLATLPAVILMSVSSDIPLVTFSLIYFFFLLGMQPLENTLVARLTPERFHHSAFGAKFALTFGVGSLSVKMVSHIEAAYGLEWVYPALGLTTLILLFGALMLIRYTKPIRV